ncbi:L,D-transpeptidase family protein [Nitrincola sp.]|uniref:L,D-transpeptidase family protein n=1 Tax=Nitrincola sp. TaxID=1926584 RepID=UPI003A8E0CD2
MAIDVLAATSMERRNLLSEFERLTAEAPPWQDLERLERLYYNLQALEDDGLTLAHYDIPLVAQQILHLVDTESLYPAVPDESVLSATYLNALMDLHLGRTHGSRVENYLNYRQQTDDLPAYIINLAIEGLSDIDQAFEQARPDTLAYTNLRKAYQQLRKQTAEQTPLPPIYPDHPSLRPGMVDERVLVLRKHLALAMPELEPALYDTEVEDAVKAFQQAEGLQADGIAGQQTLRYLNRTPQQRLDQLRVNLERWRRLDRVQQATQVIVDIAGATLRFYNEGQLILDKRTQVGRSDRPTPLILSDITHFTFNPTWTIPPTIYRKDKLPAIRANPTYLESNRLSVLDHQGNRLDPESIDWSNPGPILLRQSSGPYNALGQVVIRFPNRESIYLHDTPNKHLFDRNQRYFSSGCVRVEDATNLVALLLQSTHTEAANQFDRLINSGHTRNVNSRVPIAIILGYWTAEADTQGQVNYHTDIYNLDSALLQELNR